MYGIISRRRLWEGYPDITKSVNKHFEKHFQNLCHVMLMLNSSFYFKIYYYRVEGVDFSIWVDGRRWHCEGPGEERRFAWI